MDGDDEKLCDVALRSIRSAAEYLIACNEGQPQALCVKMTMEPSTAAALADEVIRLREAKSNAYIERNRLVCALSKLFPAHLARHPEADTRWDADWRWVVFVQLPTGQASWHIHDSELPWFDHLPKGRNTWDGHSTAEKYRRLEALRNKEA